MFAELLGRVDGTNGGHGGSMHIADLAFGIFGANGIVGAGVPWAAGAAWAFQQEASDRVAVAFFGDGAINQGVLLETLNLSAIWNLPIIFVCENNGYAVTTPAANTTAGSITERVGAYGISTATVDGMDVEHVVTAARRAVDQAREGGGPTFLECATYRFVGHHTAEGAMNLRYRTEGEIAAWRLRDPLVLGAARLGAETVASIDEAVEAKLDEALAFARASGLPSEAAAFDCVYASGLEPRRGYVE